MDVPLTPLALVERGVLVYPDRVAIAGDSGSLTYEDLADRIGRLAAAVRSLGVRPGERVALLAPNTAAALECYSGVPLSGAVLVPLNTRLSADEYGYILDHSGARVVIADADWLGMLEPVLASRPGIRLVVQASGGAGGDAPANAFDYETLLGASDPMPLDYDGIDERSMVTLNYTSGTTARPKGVAITHRGAMLNAANMVFALGVRREDVHLHVAPMFHANGWGFVWATFAMGATNVPLRRVTGEGVLREIDRAGVTTLCAAPTVLRMVLRAAAEQPHLVRRGVRIATAGGAPSAAIIEQVESVLGWHATHLYGLTETTAFVTYCEEPSELGCKPAAERARFKARQGVPLLLAGRVRTLRPDGSPVRRDGVEMGEVVARGNVIMAGYHRDEGASAEALRGGWFHTGDLAVRHPDGYVEIRDRLKDVIKSGGEQIPSIEVEAVLAEHPEVADAAVVAGPHPVWGETPVAFVVAASGAEPAVASLTAFCRERLAHFKVPTRFVFVPELPRTASGKIRKADLRQMLPKVGLDGEPG